MTNSSLEKPSKASTSLLSHCQDLFPLSLHKLLPTSFQHFLQSGLSCTYSFQFNSIQFIHPIHSLSSLVDQLNSLGHLNNWHSVLVCVQLCGSAVAACSSSLLCFVAPSFSTCPELPLFARSSCPCIIFQRQTKPEPEHTLPSHPTPRPRPRPYKRKHPSSQSSSTPRSRGQSNLILLPYIRNHLGHQPSPRERENGSANRIHLVREKHPSVLVRALVNRHLQTIFRGQYRVADSPSPPLHVCTSARQHYVPTRE